MPSAPFQQCGGHTLESETGSRTLSPEMPGAPYPGASGLEQDSDHRQAGSEGSHDRRAGKGNSCLSFKQPGRRVLWRGAVCVWSQGSVESRFMFPVGPLAGCHSR